MKQNKITFQEMYDIFSEYNAKNNVRQFEGNLYGVIVYKQENWDKPYNEESRSYKVQSSNKYFMADMLGNSIFGSCLDGTDVGVRLDLYLGQWEIDYCYILED